jgi:hypothetical protein
VARSPTLGVERLGDRGMRVLLPAQLAHPLEGLRLAGAIAERPLPFDAMSLPAQASSSGEGQARKFKDLKL